MSLLYFSGIEVCVTNSSKFVSYDVYIYTAAAKSRQSFPILCDPIDGSPPGSSIPGILQARTLEWVTISFSNAWKWKVKGKLLSRVRLLVTPWTAAHQAPPSMGFAKQEYWSRGCHCLLHTAPDKWTYLISCVDLLCVFVRFLTFFFGCVCSAGSF